MLFYVLWFIMKYILTGSEEISVRIIAGSARGLKLNTPDGLHTRPTADRVKEALFSSVAPLLSGSVVLDVFAGSGALGLEALSRGAARAVFCENDRRTFEILRENIEKVRVSDRATPVFGDALSYLASTNERFDIAFLDPPYASALYEKAFPSLYRILKPGALVVVEFEEANAPRFPDYFTEEKQKQYGRVHLAYLKRG